MPLNVLPSMTNDAGRRIARAEMEVAEPSLTPAVSPLGCEHDEIERAGLFDLQPRRPAAPGRVRRSQ